MTTLPNVTTTFDWPTALMGETLMCGLLNKALYEYPDRAWLQALIDEEVFAQAPFAEQQPDVIAGLAALQTWTAAHRAGLSVAAFDDLRADYTRLFVGIDRVLAAPWESVHFSEERLVFQEKTLQVRNWYLRYGLEPENLHKEPDDHIGLELAFLAHLAQRGLQAIEQNDPAVFEDAIAAQRGFLTEHLLKWTPIWCSLVLEHAQTEFYRGVALLVRGVLTELADMFDLKFKLDHTR